MTLTHVQRLASPILEPTRQPSVGVPACWSAASPSGVCSRLPPYGEAPYPKELAMSSRVSPWSPLVALLGFVVAPVAFGQPIEPGQPCAADVQKLCPGVKPGHGAILACLEPKQDQISQACKDTVKAKLADLY